MLDTFSNLEKKKSFRVRRERSLRAFAEASENTDGSLTGRGLPAFVDEKDPNRSGTATTSGTTGSWVSGVGREQEDMFHFAREGGSVLFGGASIEEDAWGAGDSIHSKRSEDEEFDAVLRVTHTSPQPPKACVYGGGHGLYADPNHRPGRRCPVSIVPLAWVSTFGFKPSGGANSSRKFIARMHSDEGYDLTICDADLPLDHTRHHNDDGRENRWSKRFVDKLAYLCCHPYSLFVFALVTALVVSGISYAIWTRTSSGEGGQIAISGGTVHSDYPYTDHDLARVESIARRIVSSGASTEEDLSAPTGDPKGQIPPLTPQRMAMEWLALADPAEMDPSNDFLLQRYGLAVFWFAIHPHLLLPQARPQASAYHHNIPSDRRRSLGDTDVEVDWDPDLLVSEVQQASVKAPAKKKIPPGATSHHSHHPWDLSTAEERRDADELWKATDGWMTGKGICVWHGVLCRGEQSAESFDTKDVDGITEAVEWFDSSNVDDYVIGLELSSFGIAGELPKEVFTALTELESLDLSGNKLKGTLPESMGTIKWARILNLSGNELHGTVPTSVSGLTSIQELNLGDNSFSGTIPGGALAPLGETLLELSLYNNDFEGTVPASLLGELGNVTVLYLDQLALRGPVPRELERCTKLEDLRLSDNALTGRIPPRLGEALTDLKILYLDTNELTGPLPASIARLSDLEELHLFDNHLSGWLPKEWGDGLSKLKHLYLDGNGALSGVLPPTWGTGMKALEHLYLSDNVIHGHIPPELSHLWNLERLHLRYNRFDGTVPSELGAMGKLKELTLEGNLLKGDMPKEVCDLTDLAWSSLEKLTVHCHRMEESELKCDCCTEC